MVVGYPLGYLFLGVPGYIAKTKLISLIVLPHDLAIAINLIDHIILRIALIVLPYLRCCRLSRRLSSLIHFFLRWLTKPMLEAFVSLNDVGIKAVASISEEGLCARKNSFAFRSDANGDDSGDLGDESRRVPPVSAYKLGPSLGEGSRRNAKAPKCMISAISTDPTTCLLTQPLAC